MKKDEVFYRHIATQLERLHVAMKNNAVSILHVPVSGWSNGVNKDTYYLSIGTVSKWCKFFRGQFELDMDTAPRVEEILIIANGAWKLLYKEKDREKKLGHGYSKAYRMNPYNPVSYIMIPIIYGID